MDKLNDIVHILDNTSESTANYVLNNLDLDETVKNLIAESSQHEIMLTTLSSSQTDATGSTLGLGTAFKGLAASLGISTTALGVLTAGIAAFAAGFVAFRIYKQHMEEIRQTTEESANVYKDSASSIDDYAARYQELTKELIAAKGSEEETYNVKKQLLDLQTELNDKFGDEYGTVNLVTDAYRDQTETIKAYNKEAAKAFLNENWKGIETASDEMTEERHYNLSLTGMSALTEEGASLKEIAEKYKNQGITLLDELGDGSYSQFSIHLKADAQSAYDTINEFMTDVQDEAIALGDKHIFDDVLDFSSRELNNAKEIIADYGDIYNRH